MAKRTRTKALRELIAQKLQNGETINPEEMVAMVEMTVSETEARALWIRTYVSRLVHSEARNLGMMAISCGPGEGLKAVRSTEDVELAKAIVEAQLKGQGTRGRRLLEKKRLLNQFEFELQEVMVDAHAVSEPKRAEATPA